MNLTIPRTARPIHFTEYDKRVRGVLMEAINGSRTAQLRVKAEAFSSSDFPVAFQKVNQAALQAGLAEYTPVWTEVAVKKVMDNLKLAHEFRLDVDTTNLPAVNGGKPRVPGTLPRIPEGTEYPGFGFTQSEYLYGTAKNGARIAMTWEAFQNDDWGQIANLPNEMLKLAVNSEEADVFGQYYTTLGGFNGDYFTADQNLTGNPALTLTSLQAARAKAVQPPPFPVGTRPRINSNTKWALLVSDSLEAVADTILGVNQIKVTDAQGVEYTTSPQLGGIKRVTVPWIDLLTANGNYAQTTGWALVPYQGQSIYGDTVIGATLRGKEVPELRIKNDQGQSLSGGSLSPYDGDFEADSIQIRIAQWFKATTINNYGSVWSKGTGVAGTAV